MPIAILAAPMVQKAAEVPQTSDAAAAGAGGDFAALLLGQMANGAGRLEVPQLAIVPAATDEKATTEPQDAALLLASMGLGALKQFEPQQDTTADTTEIPGSAIGTAQRSDSALLALQNAPGQATQDAAGAGHKPDADSLLARLNLPTTTASAETATPALPTAAEDTAPAKLAGFEQKLAETMAANREQTPAPQVLAAPGPVAHAAHTDTQNLRIDTPVREQSWPTEFGQKLVWMATQDKQSAQITLNPPQLGPIQISLDLKSDVASAVFTSTNADVREAIESAIPRLREMLAGVGVELGQANVSAESFRQSTANGNDSRNGGGERNANEGAAKPSLVQAGVERTATIRRGNGLVDTFA